MIIVATRTRFSIPIGAGAGAVLVERDEQSKSFIGFHLGSDGRGAQHVYRPGLSKKVNSIELIDTQYLV